MAKRPKSELILECSAVVGGVVRAVFAHHPFRQPLHKNASLSILPNGEIASLRLQEVRYLLVVDLEVGSSDQESHPATVVHTIGHSVTR